MSSLGQELRQPGPPATRRLELAAALAQLGRDPRRARAPRRPPPRSRSAASRRSRRRGSRTRRRAGPRRTADSRSATLCALAPVKCCSTLPNWSGSTTLRSTFMPACVSTRAPASPAELHRLDQRQLGQRRGQRGGVVGGGDDVEVLDRVGQAPQRAGDLDAIGRRVRAQRPDDLLGDASARESRMRGAGPPVRRARPALEQLLLDLRAEAAQPADLPAARRRRAARRASRSRARRRAAARAWARSPAGA